LALIYVTYVELNRNYILIWLQLSYFSRTRGTKIYWFFISYNFCLCKSITCTTIHIKFIRSTADETVMSKNTNQTSTDDRTNEFNLNLRNILAMGSLKQYIRFYTSKVNQNL